MIESSTIWSIGHSSHDMLRFLELLRDAGVEVVADLRSQPYSRFSPHFSRGVLRAALVEAGLGYVFLGDELGGRPPEPELYDPDGHVLYGDVARTARFGAGLARLLDGAVKYRVAMLCSEEDPTNCHRRLLVARVLIQMGVPVIHIRGDGTTLDEVELAEKLERPSQSALFGEDPSAWRSTRSVSRSTQRTTSSRV